MHSLSPYPTPANRVSIQNRSKCSPDFGVFFHEHLDYSTHCDAISKGVSRALGSIISKISNLKDFGFKSFEKLYFSCVVPVLQYGSAVLGFKAFSCLENIQNRTMRYFMVVHIYAPVLALIGNVGWLPCLYRQWISIIRLWNILIQMDDNRLTKITFNRDYRSSKHNWCSDFKDILSKICLTEYFENRRVIDMALAESKMKEAYETVWSNSIEQSPKLRTYRIFKQNLSTERYINLNMLKNECSMLAQLRCGILPLRIETGRYTGEQLDNRMCVFCTDSDIESETRFVVSCSRYQELRVQVFGQILSTDSFLCLSPDQKLCHLMKNHERQLAKFILQAFRVSRK